MNSIAIICDGDRAVARAVASRALQEFPDELSGEKYAVVGWGTVLETPVVKKKTPGGDQKYTRLALRFARSGAEYPANPP